MIMSPFLSWDEPGKFIEQVEKGCFPESCVCPIRRSYQLR